MCYLKQDTSVEFHILTQVDLTFQLPEVNVVISRFCKPQIHYICKFQMYHNNVEGGR